MKKAFMTIVVSAVLIIGSGCSSETKVKTVGSGTVSITDTPTPDCSDLAKNADMNKDKDLSSEELADVIKACVARSNAHR